MITVVVALLAGAAGTWLGHVFADKKIADRDTELDYLRAYREAHREWMKS